MTTPLWRCSYCSAFQRGAHTPSCLSCGRVGGLCGSWKYEDAVRYLRGILDAEIDEQGALRAEVAALRADVTRLSRPNLITFDEDGELVSWAIPDEMHEEYGAELREIRDAGMALRWFFVGVAQWELRRLRAFQPKPLMDKHGNSYWMPPGMEDASARGRWEAMFRALTEPCVWREDEDGIHHTGCGEMFCFDGPIVDHKQRFCGYCGAAIREVRYVEVEP